MTWTGSPGIRWMRAKTSEQTPRSTGRKRRNLRRRKDLKDTGPGKKARES